jgi:aspartyl-tRNA(Asn)/glutamyl-tRNA(Gln) amidotransferase subunit A
MAGTQPKPLVQDPGRIRDLARDIAAGRLSPVELLERYLARIEGVNGTIEAWREVDAAGARAEAETLAREARDGRLRGPLHGIPLGVKDIIDVGGLVTRCNSRSRESAAPASADAEIVLQLKRQGMLVLGKLHTTEFAFFDPSPARNPHNPEHTPGGSSSGSGAAVAGGLVPAPQGPPTVASVDRPAADGGRGPEQPSTRSTCIHGIAPLAPSYDTVGFYGYSVDDAVSLYEAAASPFVAGPGAASAAERGLRIVLPIDPHLDAATGEVRACWEGAAEALGRAGHNMVRWRSSVSFEEIFTLQRSTMLYEMSRIYAYTRDLEPGQIGAKFVAAVAEGSALTTPRYLADRARLDDLRAAVLEANPDADGFLWPAAPDTAPRGLEWTGDPRFISPWTLIGGPIVTVPLTQAANGLPLGCILAGPPGSDRTMCHSARLVAGIIERPR